MQQSGNTILITGGGSGIGRGLAEAFYANENQVIIAGRRKALLEEVVRAHPRMKAEVLDVGQKKAIGIFAKKVASTYPALNVVINCAGIMRGEDIKTSAVADAEATVTTNLLGPIRLIAALMPLLVKQPRAAIINVSSGLAFMPLALTPTYSATKAALHSYTESLRYQLKDASIQVLEIIPPYVQTELTGPAQAADPNAMPLNEFIAETMKILSTQPDANEICVERVKPLRFAEASGGYDAFFKNLNDAMAAAAATH